MASLSSATRTKSILLLPAIPSVQRDPRSLRRGRSHPGTAPHTEPIHDRFQRRVQFIGLYPACTAGLRRARPRCSKCMQHGCAHHVEFPLGSKMVGADSGTNRYYYFYYYYYYCISRESKQRKKHRLHRKPPTRSLNSALHAFLASHTPEPDHAFRSCRHVGIATESGQRRGRRIRGRCVAKAGCCSWRGRAVCAADGLVGARFTAGVTCCGWLA
jgi:hypothetical protein